MSPLFFFFFQAEDGIRFLTVTGVQTCALPISAWPGTGTKKTGLRSRNASETAEFPPLITRASAPSSSSMRSEERRVGKSVDLGGRRIIKKKKRKRTR